VSDNVESNVLIYRYECWSRVLATSSVCEKSVGHVWTEVLTINNIVNSGRTNQQYDIGPNVSGELTSQIQTFNLFKLLHLHGNLAVPQFSLLAFLPQPKFLASSTRWKINSFTININIYMYTLTLLCDI